MSEVKDVYLKTIERMEKDIAMVDTNAALASISVSLKRIADAMEEANNLHRQDAIEREIWKGQR